MFYSKLLSLLSSVTVKSEHVALFSVIVTIIIFIFTQRATLNYKKYEQRKKDYEKFVNLLFSTFSTPDKFKTDKNGNLNPEVQKEFLDVGSSLMLYASKKLYRKYIFFREFSNSEFIKKSHFYDERMIIYIVADILKQIRKEIGLANFNQLGTTESLAFFVNDFAANPFSKKTAYQMEYKIFMLKFDMFMRERICFVYSGYIINLFIKPIFSITILILYYVVCYPCIRIYQAIKKFLHKK